MIEIYGDLWQEAPKYDAVCITTNGAVKSNDEAVMGRGCALEAAKRWPDLPKLLGTLIRRHSNETLILGKRVVSRDVGSGNEPLRCILIAFPVKHKWMDDADLVLIEESSIQLARIAQDYQLKTVLLPRPGCGNGRLKWPNVRRVVEPFLDQRFTVIAKPHEWER